MKGFFAFALVLFFTWTSWAGPAATDAVSATGESFQTLDLFVDPHGKKLAAWQIEVRAHDPGVTLVGVESGQSPFTAAPFYDPKALQHGRVIVAGFSLDEAALPTGRCLVARLNWINESGKSPDFDVQLSVAGTQDGSPIPADAAGQLEESR